MKTLPSLRAADGLPVLYIRVSSVTDGGHPIALCFLFAHRANFWRDGKFVEIAEGRRENWLKNR